MIRAASLSFCCSLISSPQMFIKSGGVGILATLTAIRQPSRRTLGLSLNQYSTSE
jgi:hypothetical protein